MVRFNPGGMVVSWIPGPDDDRPPIDLSRYVVGIDLNYQGDEMATKKELQLRLESLKRATESNAREIERIEQALRGPTLADRLARLSECSVIRFSLRFHRASQVYDYAAIKTNGRWYTTGPAAPKNYSNTEMAAFIEDKILQDGVNVVAAYRGISEYDRG